MDEGRTIGGSGTPEEWLEHAGWVRALARALVRDAATADDVVQDTWLAAMRRAPRASGPLRPWLARIVRNVATDRARAETRRSDREARMDRGPQHARAPDEVAESIETQKLLLAAVERLSDPLRSAVVRRYFHGKTSIEIAREDNVAESTVRERIDRGLQALRRDLDAHHRGNRGAWMAVLVPIARRADAQAASATGSTAVIAAGTGIAMASMWKIAVAALVVVAAFVGTRAWMSVPIAIDPLEAKAQSAALDEVGLAHESDRNAPNARTSAAAIEAPATSPGVTPSAAVDRVAYAEARIVTHSGAPIPGARLICVDRADRGANQKKDAPSAACEPDGHVRLELHELDSSIGMRLGDWPDSAWMAYLEASAPNFAPHRVELMLDESQTSSCGTIVLVEGGTVTGHVVDEHDQPLSDVSVNIVLPDLSLAERDRFAWAGLDARSVAQTQTTADGSFRFEGVAVGNYRVWTQLAGRECADETCEVTAGGTTALHPLVMREDANAIIGMILGPDGHPRKARILYAPSDHAASDRWKQTNSAADGRFALDVAAGSIVDIECEERDDRRTPAWALRRNIPTGTHALVLQMSPLPVIDIAVQDEKGEAIALWNVGAHEPAGGGSGYMNLGPKHAHIPAPGLPFTLEFSADGRRPLTLGPFDPHTAPVTLVVTLERASLVTVRITGGGRRIEHLRVRGGAPLAPGARTGNGFPLRMAEYYGSGGDLEKDGAIGLAIGDDKSRILVFLPEGPDGEDAPDGFARAEVGPLVLSSVPGHELDVQLSRGGRLEGHLLGYSASASTTSFVSVSRGDGIVRSARVRADGSFGFDHMMPGEWLVRPTRRDWTDVLSTTNAPPEPANVPVTITEGATTQLDVSMPKTSGATLDGKLGWPAIDSGTWTAHIAMTEPGDGTRADTIVAADGTFHMELEEAGLHHLTLRSAGSSSASFAIECNVDLAPGANHWEFAPSLGSISETNTPADDLALEFRSAQGVVWTAQWRPKGAGQNILAPIPVGEVKITSGGRLLSTVHVQAREIAAVAWE